jgi:hypothetical protein
MERKVNIDTWQKVTRDDFNNFGNFPRESFDTIVGKLLIPDMAFDGFACTPSGPVEVTVSNGHLFYLGKVYFNNSQGGTTVDMAARLPTVTRRKVAITVFGTEQDTDLEPRTFLTDADTRATEARETSTENMRWANISAVSGTEGPDPSNPAVPANVCVVAWVTLSTLGIESIERNEESVTPTLRELDNRMNEFDVWRLLIGTLIDTLRSDLAALAAQIYGLAKFELVKRIAGDVGRIKDIMRLPDAYQSYAVDHFLTTDETDLTHVDQYSKIEEGVRFPPEAGFDAQLGLLNPFDASVINSNNVILPLWDHFQRITNVRFDAEIAVSTYNYQTMDMVQKTMSRQRTRYGTPFTVCTNGYWWDSAGNAQYTGGAGEGFVGTWDWVTWTFTRNTGEVFNIVGVAGEGTDFTLNSHAVLRLQQVWTDTVEEPYWDKITTNYSVSGAVVAESFLNAQDGWVTKLDLFFSRVAAAGNVDVFICELTNGSPDSTKILARSTRVPADIYAATAANPRATPFMFQPTFLRKGRYGIMIVTAGNHYVWVLKNTNFVSGTFFTSTDGLWFQGDLATDIAFNVYCARFVNNRTEVQLQALQLQGGIAAIDINADTIIPGGTRLVYQVQIAGVWHDLDNIDGGPSVLFIGLPPLLQFRAVFIGTDSVQPALGVASNSRVTTWRPAPTFRHISDTRTFPSSSKIQCQIRVEAWRGGPYHTILFRLMHGAGYTVLRPPDILTNAPAPDMPGYAQNFNMTWTGMGALTSCKFRIEGTTDNKLSTYHIAERFDIEDPNTGIGT